MNRLLRKIEWAIHRWNLKFNLLDIYLHDGDECIGFSLCEVIKDFRTYSLLAFEFRLPNGAERKVFQVTNWDLFYVSTPIWKWLTDMEESMLWGYRPNLVKLTLFNLLKKLY